MLVGIAKLAREGELLAEKARVDYRSLPSRRLLNRNTNTNLPFFWTINPYRGCEFACKYCYARYTHEFMELRDPADFETKIFAKSWEPAAFRNELHRIDKEESIALGTATDPYQPAERRFELTRRVLEVFAGEAGYALFITTKSDLITRDISTLVRVAERNELGVSMTITTVDNELARRLEPLAPRPELRLKAVEALRSGGIQVRVFASPVMPGINDSEESLAAVAKAAKDSGAGGFGANTLFLQPCAKRVFYPFLEQHDPRLLSVYENLYGTNAYLRGEYPKQIQARVERLRDRLTFPGWTRNRERKSESQLSLLEGVSWSSLS